MLRLILTGIFWTGILCLNFCYAQSREIPLGALPMQYNSSFAGEANHPRFSSNLSLLNQRRGLINDYYDLELATSFDQFIPAIRSGIGFNAGYRYTSFEHPDNTAVQYFTEVPSVYNIGIAIAPKFSIKGKVTISPSLDFNYKHHQSPNWEIKDYKSRIGLLANTSKGYIGISADLYNELNVIEENDSEYLPFYLDDLNQAALSLQIGYTFQRSQDSKFAFTPQMVIPLKYKEDQFFDNSKIMLNFKYDKLLFGVSDVGVHSGWQTDRLQVMGSYNLQRLIKNQGTEILNLSFQYTFKRR